MVHTIKKLAIIGSTGSIGRQTIDVVRTLPGRFRIVALAAGTNLSLLTKQIDEFKPQFVHCQNPGKLKTDADYALLSPEKIASCPETDIVVIAAAGKAGLSPVLAAVKAGKTIALANKEALVAAGEIIIAIARRHSARVLPVDSEHSAIWQCLEGEKQKASRLILTASGGPFLRYTPAQMEEVTVKQALRHPSWQMGKKVTIDSATLMNKGLEVIEAHWLFNMPYDAISITIHPQSIVHSMVELADGSIKAQLSYPDMRLPIQLALTYPERLPNPHLPKLDWGSNLNLTFEPPDLAQFPCLKLAMEAGKKGDTYPAVLCAADEMAVDFFLSGRIKFTDIVGLIGQVLDAHTAISHPTIEQILAMDDWARQRIVHILKDKS